MKKIFIIYLILITFFCEAQSVTSIINSVTYDRSVRKGIYPNPNVPLLKYFIRFDGDESPSTADLRTTLSNFIDNAQFINIQKVPLAARTGQAFYLSASNTNVEIRYTTLQSLDNAIYTYLNLLGITWYGAGVNWLVQPTIPNIVNIPGQWYEPTFRARNFSGTGGLDYPLSIDTFHTYKSNWLAFKRRNRFNGDFSQPAHAGIAFYNANTALSKANPQWFYDTIGMVSGRIRVEIPAAVQAYKDWYARTPNLTDSFVTVNADPEDGRGNGPQDPLPPNGFNGINNWNASDKWWYFANEIAKVYDSNNVRIHIAALSYGDGPTITLVPKFPLKKNVYPVVTPYAFQTAYLPKQMIKTWHANTAGNMGIYDYWNITQYSLGLPQFNIYSIPSSLSFWRQNAIDGVQLETTDAGGAMGHTFWLTGQMQFDTTKNIDTLFKKYLVDCFGLGWQPMKNMFDRWSLKYQNNQDVNFSLNDLNNATNLVVINSPQWKRINDLKAYVHFMKLMAQRNSQDTASNNAVYQYIYSIHQRMLVQTVAFTGQQYLGPAPAPLSAHQLTETEIETNFNADFAALPVQYSISNFVYNFDKVTYVDSIPLAAWSQAYFAAAFFKSPFTGNVSIDMGTRDVSTAKIFSEDSIFVNETINYTTNYTFSETIGSYAWHEKNYNINVVAGKTYNVGTSPSGLGRVRMRTAGLVLFLVNGGNDFDNASYPLKYFYVPKGTTQIAYQDPQPQPFNGRGYLIPPGGTGLVRTATNAQYIYTVNVPTGADGQVWKADFGHGNWKFNSIPNLSTLQNFSYTE